MNGKEIALNTIQRLEREAQASKKKVCFISFNPTPASESFITAKTRVAKRLGIEVVLRDEPGLSTEEAIKRIGEVAKEGFDGIVVQLPLRGDMDTVAVLNSIPTELDIDLLGEESKLAYKEGKTDRVPPVAGAIEEIFKAHNVSLEEKRIVILGKGRLV
ncbi:MAG: tetrahydrofolate dehydrogenase/cyclohydrolase catalytic domain-containing protein, partial [Parcubacteria group bacterium]